MEVWWRDYAFLTHEVYKFADRQNWDMVLNLLDQRAMLQTQIDEQADRGFADSAAGQALIGEIMREEQAISQKSDNRAIRRKTDKRLPKRMTLFPPFPRGFC